MLASDLCVNCPFHSKPSTKIANFPAFELAIKNGAILCCISFPEQKCQGQYNSDLIDLRKIHEELPGQGWVLSDNCSEPFPLDQN